MTEIQQNRYDQLVRRVANIVAPGSIVGDALNELFPMIDVENLNAELALLGKWRLGFGSVRHTSLAGNFNHAQLFNPVGSGSIVVLERVDVQSTTGQRIEYVVAVMPLTDFTANEALRDTREGITIQPLAQARSVQQVGGLPEFGQFQILSNTNFTFEEKRGLFVLGPGTGVTFATTAVAQGSIFSFLWRERVAEPAELNF